jgi:cell wall assembly regulator SMI1
MSDARAVWKRIEAWLAQHSAGGLAALGGPASEEQLEQCQEALCRPLPEAVRASYRIHDGQILPGPFLLGDWQLLTLEEVEGQWRMMNGLPVTAGWYADLVPLFTNGGGDFYCFDRSGQIIVYRHDDGPKDAIAHDLVALLERHADELEAGLFVDEDGWLVRREDS